MDRTVYVGAIASCLFLMIGSVFFPNGAGMWLASSSLSMNITRIILVLLFFGLMTTAPPRTRVFRMVLGVTSLGLVAWAINWALSGTMNLIDSVVFLEAAAVFGLAATELTGPNELSEKSLGTNSYFVKSVQITPTVQGVVMPPMRLAGVLQGGLLIVGILAGLLRETIRPYRELWRGS